jgi:hypothetical protein
VRQLSGRRHGPDVERRVVVDVADARSGERNELNAGERLRVVLDGGAGVGVIGSSSYDESNVRFQRR